MASSPPSKFPTLVEAAQKTSIHTSSKSREIPNKSKIIIDTKLSSDKVLTLQTIPKSFVDVKYAVRGEIVKYGQTLEKRLATIKQNVSTQKFAFEKIIPANIGNPQAVGQLPITFHRQVLTCLLNPELIPAELNDNFNDVITKKTSTTANDKDKYIYPIDVYLRAKKYLAEIKSMGAYTSSQGVEYFRKLVAKWITERDSYECDPQTIFLTEGGTPAIRTVLELLIENEKDGILIPIPQYPLYSALITKMGGKIVPYYLDEANSWSLWIDELDRAIKAAKEKGISVKALVVINPGNPTGSVLRESQLSQIVDFCQQNKLLIIADEVYQCVVHTELSSFKSLRKCVMEKHPGSVEVVSIHSLSKSIGECGLRGGFMQFQNVSSDVIQIVLKLMSIMLCPNTVGQATIASLVDPLEVTDPSYALWHQETQAMLYDLRTKADLAYKHLNKIPGISCQPILGAMYAFPRIQLPEKAIAKAAELEIDPDLLYCKEMLAETGVMCVPGSGFHQVEGTFHFRITILPDVETYKKVLMDIEKFHISFIQRYS